MDNEQFVTFYRAVAADPEVEPGFSELADLRECTDAPITAAGMRRVQEIAEAFLASAGQVMRCSVVAPDDLTFGVTRMYEMWGGETAEAVHVFRAPGPAMEWLGLPPSTRLEDLHSQGRVRALPGAPSD